MPTTAESHQLVARPATLMAAVAIVATNALLLSPVLSEVATTLGSTNVTTALAISIYGAGVMLSALLIAPRIDRLGALRALDVALPVLGVGLLMSATAPHVGVLLGAQALAGLSAGVILPASYALATSSGPPAEAARTLATVLLGWSVAFVGGIPVLTVLADHVTWRVSYAALLGGTVVVWRWTHTSGGTLPAPSGVIGATGGPARGPAHADAPAGVPSSTAVGTGRVAPWRRAVPLAAVGLCFATVLYGALAFVTDGPRYASNPSASVRADVTGLTVIADHATLRASYGAAVLGIALVVWLWIRASIGPPMPTGSSEASAATGPAAPWRRVVPLIVTGLCFASAFYGVFAFFADEVRHTAGMSATVAGLIVLAFGVGFAWARSTSTLVARLGVARLLPLVLLGNAAVYLLMTIAGGYQATVFAVALAWGALTNASLTMIVLLFAQVDSHRRGRALGINSATTYLGAMVGTAAAGAADSTLGFEAVLVGAAALQLCGAAVIWIVSSTTKYAAALSGRRRRAGPPVRGPGSWGRSRAR